LALHLIVIPGLTEQLAENRRKSFAASLFNRAGREAARAAAQGSRYVTHKEAGEMRRRGEELVRQGRALIRAADRLTGDDEAIVDFASLPGRSPEMRAEALYMGRRIRDRMFPGNVFGEPAWDILLALYLATLKDGPLPVEPLFKELALGSATGGRYIAFLGDCDLVAHMDTDGVEPAKAWLTSGGVRLMTRFFELTESAAPRSEIGIARRRRGRGG